MLLSGQKLLGGVSSDLHSTINPEMWLIPHESQLRERKSGVLCLEGLSEDFISLFANFMLLPFTKLVKLDYEKTHN